MKKGVGEPVTYRLLLHLGRFGLEIAGFCEIIMQMQKEATFSHQFLGFFYFSVFTKETLSAMCKISSRARYASTQNWRLLLVSIQVTVLR